MNREQRLEAVLRELNDHLSFCDAPSELFDRVDAILAEPAPAQDERDLVAETLEWYAGMGKSGARARTALAAYQATRPAQTAPQHPDDEAVDRFAAAMKAKLAAARAKGRGGWDDPNVCSVEFLAQLLVEHLAKGNAGTFEDVANFAMMLHQRGAEPKVLAEAAEAPIKKARGEALELGVRAMESKTAPQPDQSVPNSDCEWCAGVDKDHFGEKCEHCQPTKGGE